MVRGFEEKFEVLFRADGQDFSDGILAVLALEIAGVRGLN